MRAVFVSACTVEPEMVRYIKPGDWVVACDAGYRNCQAMGVEPDLVTGDFDTAPPPDQPNLIVLPAEKDDTDTQYAARLAVEKGCDEVVMLGALGGWRLDHTLASLGTALWLARHDVRVLLADEHTEIRILLAGQKLELERGDWGYFSLFPLEGRAEGITLTGAHYPLDHGSLDFEYPLGVSNAFDAPKVQVSLEKGSLAVFCTQKEPR